MTYCTIQNCLKNVGMLNFVILDIDLALNIDPVIHKVSKWLDTL